jgi:hypothetical protein
VLFLICLISSLLLTAMPEVEIATAPGRRAVEANGAGSDVTLFWSLGPSGRRDGG